MGGVVFMTIESELIIHLWQKKEVTSTICVEKVKYWP